MNTFAPNYSATIKTEFFFSLVHDILEVGIQRYLVLQVYFYKSLLALGVRNALRSIDQIFSSSPEISSRSPLLNTLHYLYNTTEHRNNAFLALYLGQRKAICLEIRPGAPPGEFGNTGLRTSAIKICQL